MKFVFISERTFEPWDWTNPEIAGIGGSETSHIEMAQRLARAGHDVMSYAPLMDDTQMVGMSRITGFAGPAAAAFTDPAGVEWRAIEKFLSVTGRAHVPDLVYVIYRAPHLVDLLPAGSIAWLICQDTDYVRPDNLLDLDRASRFTRIITLCEAQRKAMRRRLDSLPGSKGRRDNIAVSSNGIKRETIEALESLSSETPYGPERNEYRLIYASSPDRGLENLLPIFERVREIVPEAELHVCYGFNNIDKVIDRIDQQGYTVNPVAETRARLLSEMERLGVHHYGRLGQSELLGHWLRSAVWCHPSNFTETSCITCMDAQACGAIPVTNPIWAVGENVQHGVFIEGDVRSEAIRARYVHAVAELLLNPQMQQEHRRDMMPWARGRFDWDNFAVQWQYWAEQDIDEHRRPRFQAVDEYAARPVRELYSEGDQVLYPHPEGVSK